MAPTRILGISGSLRAHSTNTAVLETAVRLDRPGIVVVRFRGVADLPHFDPDDDRHPLPPEVADLRAAIHRADALLLSTPEYAGALPGAFKNVLDWLIGDDQPRSIVGKPVAWINVSVREARHAHESLRLVLDYASAVVVEAACAHFPVTSADLGTDDLVTDPALRDSIAAVLDALAAHARVAGAPVGEDR